MIRKLLPSALLLALVALAAAPAGGSLSQRDYAPGSEVREPNRGNPCLTRKREQLLCPDLKIARPTEMYIDTLTRDGRRLLRATNNIRSRGDGPAEIRGVKISDLSMAVTQRIHKRAGGKLAIKTTGRLDFYPIPGQYRYWKYRDAAAFELWSVGSEGKPLTRLRTGPKLHYCLRDLTHTRPGQPGSPPRRVYPACSQDPNRRAVVLGTSVGWSDIYPSTYHQNWINVSGLRGCFAFFHIVDPKNHIRELNERNNRSNVFIRLPSATVVSECPGRPTGGIG